MWSQVSLSETGTMYCFFGLGIASESQGLYLSCTPFCGRIRRTSALTDIVAFKPQQPLALAGTLFYFVRFARFSGIRIIRMHIHTLVHHHRLTVLTAELDPH